MLLLRLSSPSITFSDFKKTHLFLSAVVYLISILPPFLAIAAFYSLKKQAEVRDRRGLTMRKPCCEKQEMNRGAWSEQEDQKLIDYIKKHGEGCWRTLPQAAGLLRCGKSCRVRWINYLRPDLKRGNFAEDEEDLLIKLHALLGNRWSLIAGRLPGRTDNEVKNYWNYHLKRKLIKMGVDPNNHRLTHNIRLLENPATSSSTTSSADLKENGKKKSQKPDCQNNDQVSDSTSALEDEANGLPDLNLDLSMKILATSPTSIAESSERSRKSHLASSPALLLFL